MGNLDIISNGVDHLALIAEMNYKFTKTRDIKKVLQKGLELVAAHLDAEAASVFLQNDDKSELICRACAGPIDIEGLSIPANEKSIIGETVSKRVSKLVRDVTKDPDFDVNVDKKTGFVTRSILCAPLQFENDCIGAIEVINKRAGNGLFNEQDKKLLEALGSSAALAIINARMAKELIGKEVMRKELELAAEIQRGLLPENLPDDFPVHGINVPAKTVSGDFFDTGKLEDGRVWFNLGDVSGKGMNAALLMAKTSSLFRCLAKTIHSPSKLLAVINNELCETNSKGMFVTMVGGFFDPATGNVCFANAGHEPPLYFDSETKTFIDFPAEAPPLGIARDIAGSDGYPEEEINLNDGSFYIFTDGLTEARTNNKELEEKGVRKLISNISKFPANEQPKTLLDILNSTKTKLHDDVTFLVVNHHKKLLSMKISAKAENLKKIRTEIKKTAKKCTSCEKTINDIVLAVDEACQNIIRHAYKEYRDGNNIIVEVSQNGDNIIVYLTDFAPSVELDKIVPRDFDDIRAGGLGTSFIREIMDKVEFIKPPKNAGNLLKMVKKVKK